MKRATKIEDWLDRHAKTREWLWFGGLWCAGLATAMLLAYPIKLLIRSL